MGAKLKSTGAVLAGIAVNFLAVPVDVVLHLQGIYPAPGQPMSDPLYVLALSYRALLAVAGGYTVARLAPSQPLKHAMILAGIGTVMSTAGMLAMWDLGHQWYPLSLIALCFPASWLGARLSVAYKP